MTNYDRWKRIKAPIHIRSSITNYTPGSAMWLVGEAAASIEESGAISGLDMQELSLKFGLLHTQEQQDLSRLFRAISKAERIVRVGVA
jgi:hypothetical protein